MYEVELRGLLKEDKYYYLLDYLRASSEHVVEDNKLADFYDISNGILKVVDETSKNSYKLSYKVGDEFAGKGMEEMEVYLCDDQSAAGCRTVLNRLGYKVKSSVVQTRTNFLYKGVELAIKHTPSWSYHFEAEILVDEVAKIPEARKTIKSVCDELDITPMSSDELKDFIAKLETK